jgi:hypothetical protein
VERAAQDSESSAWPPGEIFAFEQTAETAPRTAKDLQRLALRRFEDIQHDLSHADFTQGGTLKAQPNETAVQNWMADRLHSLRGRDHRRQAARPCDKYRRRITGCAAAGARRRRFRL